MDAKPHRVNEVGLLTSLTSPPSPLPWKQSLLLVMCGSLCCHQSRKDSAGPSCGQFPADITDFAKVKSSDPRQPTLLPSGKEKAGTIQVT